MSWHVDKASCCVRAWRRLYGCDPGAHAVTMVCSVAALETRCGDSWGNSGNWGAIQIPRGAQVDSEFAEVHGDSSPITGAYQIRFWRFPESTPYPPCGLSGSDAGAWMLLRVLLDQRPQIKSVIDRVDSTTLAALMYQSHYFEGVHDPRQPGGADANIADYARGIAANRAGFDAALSGWSPAFVPTLPPWLQAANDELVEQSLTDDLWDAADPVNGHRPASDE